MVAELNWFSVAWGWSRGYVYGGSGQLIAVQQDWQVRWVHEDPVTKTKRMTDSAGAVISTIVFDPWGGAIGSPWSQNTGQQRRRFTTYERDGNETDEAMFRRYNRWTARFDQPDPYDGSYDFTNPQSFNRYSYVQNDPVNFVDPTGLDECGPGDWCIITAGNPNGGVTGILGGDTGIRIIDPPGEPINGGGGGTERPNPTVQGKVNDALGNPDCITFMKTILNNASTEANPVLEGGDIQKIFSNFLAQRKGGISRGRLTRFGSAYGRIGKDGKGNGTITVPLYKDPNPVGQDWYDASGIVNELPHIAGSRGGFPKRNEYDDYALAVAVYNSNYASRTSFKTPKNNAFLAFPDYRAAGKGQNRYNGLWSSYFHDILRKLCPVE